MWRVGDRETEGREEVSGIYLPSLGHGESSKVFEHGSGLMRAAL